MKTFFRLPKSFLLTFVVFPLLFSCSAMLSSPLEILSWSPGEDVGSPSDISEVELIFNREPEPVCTEGAFSITTEGTEVPGRVSIEGTALTFVPYSQMEDNTDYEIKLTTSAEDSKGNSLLEDFQAKFRIGERGQRPLIVSVSPADDETVDDQQKPVAVVFNTPVSLDSVLSAFSISPSVTGVSKLDTNLTVFTFTPAEKLEWQQEYTIVISTDLKSTNGYALSEEYSSSFRVGTDEEPPSITSAVSDEGSLNLIASTSDGQEINVNTGWEKDWGIRLGFSEEVERGSAEAAITVEPDIDFDITFNDSVNPSEMLINFNDDLSWHELYRIAVSTGMSDLQDNCIEEEYIYYIFVDDPGSSPPLLERVNMSPDGGTGFCIYDAETPAAAVSSHEILDTSGGDATEDPYYIDYYFGLADGAELPFFGLVENFLISPEDSCILVSYLDFQIFNPGDSLAAASAPVPTPEADQGVVRLITSLTDDAGQSGLILFQIYSDLTDSLGNSMTEDWTAELFDEDS